MSSKKVNAAYVIRYKPDGRFYIGSTSNYLNRKAHHRWALTNNKSSCPELQKTFNEEKNHDLFEWEVFICDDRETALKLEQKFLDESLGSKLLLNASTDARSPISGLVITEKSRVQARANILKAIQDPDHRKKISVKMKEVWSQGDRKKQRTGSGNPFARAIVVDGVMFGSVKDAQKALSLNEKTLRKRANSSEYANYYWYDKLDNGIKLYHDPHCENADKALSRILMINKRNKTISEATRDKWKDPARRARITGAGNPFAKALTVDGVLYGSVKDAERSLGLNEKTIRKRVNSYDHPTYKWVTGQ